jgi:alpha 1,3-glucosidase
VKNGEFSFVGYCWPGDSMWIDFFNKGASNYWSSLYSYEKFLGTSEAFGGIWIDMNEPSVFSQDETTMPKHL